MPFTLKNEQRNDLVLVSKRSPEDVVEMCKAAFDYLIHGPKPQRFEILAKKYETTPQILERTVEALISFLIDATKSNASDVDIQNLEGDSDFNEETLEILSQFVTSKRNFIEGSIKTANLRSYRIVNIEWRLESRIASRSLHKQNRIFVTMKLYLHTEPKNENRHLLPQEGENSSIPQEERQNRKDVLVQTDISSLIYMIQTLEEALMESKTRRIRNIIEALQ